MTALPALQFVNFVREDGKPAAGLVRVDQLRSRRSRLTIDEQAAAYDASAFECVDYIFFRRFSDGRSSQLAAYVVDNADERLDNQALATLHKQLWLHGTAPLLYVAWPSRVDILSCARGPDFWRDGQLRFEPAARLSLDSIETGAAVSAELDKRSRFSALRLADGTFWDEPRNAELANHDKAAHRSLIQAVVEADNAIDGGNRPGLRRLLLLMVLIKYLEDRRVFPQAWFGRFCKGAKSFFDILKAAEPASLRRVLSFLKRKFNGDVFTTGDDTLSAADLRRFAELVESRTLGRQRYLWEQFSFEYLPVEILSHLYQRFVKGGHGTVYTPPFLAALLLDQVMPYEEIKGDERILDPACGSGVFLVGAFRRLITKWRSQNGWGQVDVETLKTIARKSIFGVELDPDAADLAAFSLALAICDALKPEVIWGDLRFDPLRGSNLFHADYFETVAGTGTGFPALNGTGFHVVIGNPPFESQLSSAGAEVSERGKRVRGKLPDNQAAYLFLEQAFQAARPGGRVCLIQPSSFLYNRKVGALRKSLIRQYRFDNILDFTSIRNLYAKDPKTIAVLATKRKPRPDHMVRHWTFRRTFSTHERIAFELDHYDRHRVSQIDAESDPFVWRAGLLGGGRLLELSRRLRRVKRTLAAYVTAERWDYGEGFIVGNKKHPAPFLTGQPFLPTEALTESGIDETRVATVEELLFEGPRQEGLYTPPLLLIRENESLPIAIWEKGRLAYRDKIVGIHSANAIALREVYKRFQKEIATFRFCCALNGSQLLVGKSTAILKQDIDSLPYPEDANELRLSFWEEILRDDVLRYMSPFIRKGQNSELLRQQSGAADVQSYAEVFCRLLGSVYENLVAGKPVFVEGLICQPFFFGDCSGAPSAVTQGGESLRRLVYQDLGEALRTVRLVRFYDDNAIWIVKPDRLRYWIRTTAIRDADDTLADLYRQGY